MTPALSAPVLTQWLGRAPPLHRSQLPISCSAFPAATVESSTFPATRSRIPVPRAPVSQPLSQGLAAGWGPGFLGGGVLRGYRPVSLPGPVPTGMGYKGVQWVWVTQSLQTAQPWCCVLGQPGLSVVGRRVPHTVQAGFSQMVVERPCVHREGSCESRPFCLSLGENPVVIHHSSFCCPASCWPRVSCSPQLVLSPVTCPV